MTPIPNVVVRFSHLTAYPNEDERAILDLVGDFRILTAEGRKTEWVKMPISDLIRTILTYFERKEQKIQGLGDTPTTQTECKLDAEPSNVLRLELRRFFGIVDLVLTQRVPPTGWLCFENEGVCWLPIDKPALMSEYLEEWLWTYFKMDTILKEEYFQIANGNRPTYLEMIKLHILKSDPDLWERILLEAQKGQTYRVSGRLRISLSPSDLVGDYVKTSIKEYMSKDRENTPEIICEIYDCAYYLGLDHDVVIEDFIDSFMEKLISSAPYDPTFQLSKPKYHQALIYRSKDEYSNKLKPEIFDFRQKTYRTINSADYIGNFGATLIEEIKSTVIEECQQILSQWIPNLSRLYTFSNSVLVEHNPKNAILTIGHNTEKIPVYLYDFLDSVMNRFYVSGVKTMLGGTRFLDGEVTEYDAHRLILINCDKKTFKKVLLKSRKLVKCHKINFLVETNSAADVDLVLDSRWLVSRFGQEGAYRHVDKPSYFNVLAQMIMTH
jgi:hypothetical protein